MDKYTCIEIDELNLERIRTQAEHRIALRRMLHGDDPERYYAHILSEFKNDTSPEDSLILLKQLKAAVIIANSKHQELKLLEESRSIVDGMKSV